MSDLIDRQAAIDAVRTKNGYVFQDTCDNDDGMIGLEGNGDWDDIVAWMPLPEPYEDCEE